MNLRNFKITAAMMISTIISICGAFGQTASLLPNALQQFFDNNGNPLSSGTVTFYVPNTTTKKTIWKDANKMTAWSNPITLDAAGRAAGSLGIYGDGEYSQLLKDRNGTTIWNQLTSSTGAGGATPITVGDGDVVGTMKPFAGLTAPAQYAFAYGQELSRITYSVLLTTLTYTQNVNCTSSSTTLSGLATTEQFSVGTVVEATCIPPGSTVVSKTGTTVVISNAAVITTTTTATFFPFGNGDGSLTFNLPDMRGYSVAGRANMGGVAASTLTSVYFAAPGQNAKGGNQSKTLAVSELPAHAHNYIRSAPGFDWTATQTNLTTAGSGNFTFTSSTPSAVTLATTLTGGASAFSIVQPTVTLNIIIKTTPDTATGVNVGVASIQGMTGALTCASSLTCTGNILSLTAISGDVTVTTSSVSTINTSVVTNAKLANAVAASIKLNLTNASAAVSDVTPSALADVGVIDATNDYFIIKSASTNTLRRANTNAIAAAIGSGTGVSSLNTLTGALTVLAGSNVTVTPGAGTLTISAVGGGGSGCTTPLSSNAFCVGGNGSLSGTNNTAVGVNTATNLTTGNSNTAYGYSAGLSMSSASGNTLLGYAAGYELSGGVFPAGTNNTFAGYASGYACTQCYYNTGIGLFAMQWVTTGALENTAVGATAGLSITTGSRNVAIGANALGGDYDRPGPTGHPITGTDNSIVGYNAGIGFISGYNNSCLGSNSCGVYVPSVVTGANNAVVGYSAMISMTSGSNNVVIGSTTGNDLTAGSTNILIGFGAGEGIQGGNFNTIINSSTTSVGAGARSGLVVLGNNINLSASNNNEIFIGDGVGNVRIFSNGAGAVSISGTSTNDNALAGKYGEILQASRLGAAEVALTNATSINITSQSFTAGDWDVSGQCTFETDVTTTVQYFRCGISTSTGALPSSDSFATSGTNYDASGTTVLGSILTQMPTPVVRASLSGSTSYYLVGYSAFGTSFVKAFGTIRGRRLR